MTDDPDLFDGKGRSPPPPGVPSDQWWVWWKFEDLALDLAQGDPTIPRRPFKRYSARAILHRIRWHARVELPDSSPRRGFKCNNNWTPKMSRWWLDLHPEHPNFFELRERIDDGYSEAAE